MKWGGRTVREGEDFHVDQKQCRKVLSRNIGVRNRASGRGCSLGGCFL